MAILGHDPQLLARRRGLPVVADKGYVPAELTATSPSETPGSCDRPTATAPRTGSNRSSR
ncbi:hypothetical protein GCM10010470_26710 [Saccharopolyspora taberi]|uniref:Transposase n=1 Tax=Saccharopolyspora taberi TaxID=60895 RepID=A0ABN3VC69_9PSEU